MSAWFNIVTKTSNQKIYNHSGLSSDSKVSGYAFSKFLSRETSKNNLIPILKKYKKIENVTKKIKDKKIKIVAKTGTMFFIRGLAGYIIIDEEPYASFTILFANNYLREKIKNKSSGRPKGSKSWLSRNKISEKKIIEYWVKSI